VMPVEAVSSTYRRRVIGRPFGCARASRSHTHQPKPQRTCTDGRVERVSTQRWTPARNEEAEPGGATLSAAQRKHPEPGGAHVSGRSDSTVKANARLARDTHGKSLVRGNMRAVTVSDEHHLS
jgi:hypothetical protein